MELKMSSQSCLPLASQSQSQTQTGTPVAPRILRDFYSEVRSLHDVLTEILHLSQHLLYEDTDSLRYTELLRCTLVCVTGTPLWPVSSRDYHSSMDELLCRTIEKLKRKGTKNVLSFGFSLRRAESAGLVSVSAPNLEYVYPNSLYNLLLQSHWATLLLRVGDEAMQQLLELSSLYVYVRGSKSCYVQLTGTPLYDLHRQLGSTSRSKTRPYNPHLALMRNSFLYSKILCERLSNTAILKAEEILEAIKQCDVENDSKQGAGVCAEQDPLPDTVVDELKRCIQIFVDNNKSCCYGKLLNRYASKHPRPPPASAPVRDVATPAPHPTTILQVPVYTRGKTGVQKVIQMKSSSANTPQVAGPIDGSHRAAPGLTVGQLLENHVSHRQVYLFLRCAIHAVVPVDLLGDPANRRQFCKSVRLLVGLGRYEQFRLGQLMSGLKTNTITWLHGVKDHRERVHMLAKVVMWLTTRWLFPVIKGYFYVTETAVSKNRLFYYRKKVWIHLHRKALTGLKAKGFQDISQAQESELRAASLGVSPLRFLPKSASLRPIINMGIKSTTPGQKWPQSINTQLKPVLGVLSKIKDCQPDISGASVFGMEDIYTRWRHFVTTCRNQQRTKLYAVKVDLAHCYDSVQQNKLWQLLNDLLSQNCVEEYVTRSWSDLMGPRGMVRREMRSSTSSLSALQPDFYRFAQRECRRRSLSNAILVDHVIYQHLPSSKILKLLHKHLFTNLVTIGGRCLHQTTGISQGSVLSTLLASLYLAHMEQRHLVNAMPEPGQRHLVNALPEPGQHHLVNNALPEPGQRPLVNELPEPGQRPLVNALPELGLRHLVNALPKPENVPLVNVLDNPEQRPLVSEQYKPQHRPLVIASSSQSSQESELMQNIPQALTLSSQNSESQSGVSLESLRGSPRSVLQEELLMRQVDDYLFVTPHLERAQTFLELLSAGIKDYNCSINTDKSLVNFPPRCVRGVEVIGEGETFPWCGLLFDLEALSVRNDYSRLSVTSMADSLTMELGKQPGATLKNKLIKTLSMRSYTILIDPNINAAHVIALNVFQLFLLAAFQFHSGVRRLPLRSGRIHNNPRFVGKLITDLSSRLYAIVQRKLQRNHGAKSVHNLTLHGMTYLCTQAFSLKLTRHQGGWFNVLRMLRRKQLRLQRLLVKECGIKVVQCLKSVSCNIPLQFDDVHS